MKAIKRLMAILLVIMLMAAMLCVNVGAADNSGSITINGTVANASYQLYKVFEIETVGTGENTVYYYTPMEKWTGFFAEGGNGALYGTVTNGYIVWKNQNLFSGDKSIQGTAIAAFAKLAQEYAIEKSISADVTATSTGSSITISNLTNGAYYLVDSSLGATAIAGPVNPNFTINEKNSASAAPTIVKGVGSNNVEYMSVDVGTLFDYTVEIILNEAVAPVDDVSMTLTDVVPKHIAVTENSLKVKLNGTSELTKDTDYTVIRGDATAAGETVTHTVKFSRGFNANDKVTLTYTAKLVPVGTTLPVVHEMYTNLAKLEYGDKHVSDTASVFTLGVDGYKYYLDDAGREQKLAGAQFVLKNSEGEFYKNEDNVVSWVAEQGNASVMTSDTDGKFAFYGIASGTYTLVETKAPDGYTGAGETTLTIDRNAAEVEIENIKGTTTILPETGGIGTTVFYIVGFALVVGAAVLLIARKRKNAEG